MEKQLGKMMSLLACSSCLAKSDVDGPLPAMVRIHCAAGPLLLSMLSAAFRGSEVWSEVSPTNTACLSSPSRP
jgi:hypothetical protein